MMEPDGIGIKIGVEASHNSGRNQTLEDTNPQQPTATDQPPMIEIVPIGNCGEFKVSPTQWPPLLFECLQLFHVPV